MLNTTINIITHIHGANTLLLYLAILGHIFRKQTASHARHCSITLSECPVTLKLTVYRRMGSRTRVMKIGQNVQQLAEYFYKYNIVLLALCLNHTQQQGGHHLTIPKTETFPKYHS